MGNQRTMSNSQRALQLWSLLVLAAKTHTVLTYGDVAKMTGLANEHPHPLGHIAYYCMKNKLPLLTVLEVNEKTGMFGMELALESGRKILEEPPTRRSGFCSVSAAAATLSNITSPIASSNWHPRAHRKNLSY